MCKQILSLNPSILLLFEISEPSLYTIDQELRKALPDSVTLIPILGSCVDPNLLTTVFHKYSVEYVFHAAAYKHVPLVESNPLSGLINNVIATR